jgi:hypothetical protein
MASAAARIITGGWLACPAIKISHAKRIGEPENAPSILVTIQLLSKKKTL